MDYLSRHGVQASSHYVIDATAARGEAFTRVVRLVPEDEKAWTARSANPYFVQYELIGRARRSRAEWLSKYRLQLETLAALVAEDSFQHDFPAAHSVPGVVGHADLSRFGYPNDHTDPGTGFPWDVFLRMVRDARQLGIVPDKVDVNAKGRPRPTGVPRRIPRALLQLHEWQLGLPKWKSKPRPVVAGSEPAWYYAWRRWRLGVDH